MAYGSKRDAERQRYRRRLSVRFVSLNGDTLPLAEWRGRPVLVVNVASYCGYTPQYRDLQVLWRRYRDRGLVVLGVPSNDFGQQEPGTAAEIKQFCETNYQVDFPLTERNQVVGPVAHPFYRWVAANLGEAGSPRWNFCKYLIGPDGQLVGAWPSQVRPTEPRSPPRSTRRSPRGDPRPHHGGSTWNMSTVICHAPDIRFQWTSERPLVTTGGRPCGTICDVQFHSMIARSSPASIFTSEKRIVFGPAAWLRRCTARIASRPAMVCPPGPNSTASGA